MLSSVRAFRTCGRTLALPSSKCQHLSNRLSKPHSMQPTLSFSTLPPPQRTTSRSYLIASPLRTVLLATTAGVAGPLWLRKPVACEGFMGRQKSVDSVADAIDAAMRQSRTSDEVATKSVFHKGELTFGTFLGFCTGYLVKKVGKLFALAVGTGFIFLQYMSVKGFITVHWDRLEGGYRKQLDVDNDGKVTKRDVHSRWQSFMGFLTHNLQFKSTFLIGFYAGARYG